MRPGSVALAGALLSACVLPDRGIVIVDEDVQNKHPVRFVEPTPVTNEAANVCQQELIDTSMTTKVCQTGDPSTILPHFLDPDYEDENDDFRYDFCACDPQQADTRKLPAVTLYVEDRANDVDDGLGPIYAALQLDLNPDETEPQQAVEYIGYVDPSAALAATDLEYAPPRRPNEAAGRALRVVNLGTAERQIDLCNGAGTTPLTRGFHTLRVLVTDSPWFVPTGDKKVQQVQQFGVPDLANGATYDSIEYIFHCDDKTDDHCDAQCVTQEPE